MAIKQDINMKADANFPDDVLEYFPDTGLFVWKVSPARNIAAGSVAGTINKSSGYQIICYHGRKYRAHRVAWLLMTGEWPAGLIDHRNCDTRDNRWLNLRIATPLQSSFNRRGWGKFPKGAYIDRNGKFRSMIRVEGKNYYLGTFQSIEEAAATYAAAAKKYFGEFARTA